MITMEPREDRAARLRRAEFERQYRARQQARRAAVIAAVGVMMVLGSIGTAITGMVNPSSASVSWPIALLGIVVAGVIALLGFAGMANYPDDTPNPREATIIFASTLIAVGAIVVAVNVWAMFATGYGEIFAEMPWALPAAVLEIAIGILALNLRSTPAE